MLTDTLKHCCSVSFHDRNVPHLIVVFQSESNEVRMWRPLVGMAPHDAEKPEDSELQLLLASMGLVSP